MKRYPIGQKVRLTYSRLDKRHIGAEGVVLGPAPDYITENIAGDDPCYTINFPGNVAPDGTTIWFAAHRDLEPILNEYDGHETTTWDECPWQPEGVKQTYSSRAVHMTEGDQP